MFLCELAEPGDWKMSDAEPELVISGETPVCVVSDMASQINQFDETLAHF